MLTRGAVWLALLGGIFFAADLSLYSTAVLNSSATNATVLGNNTPIFVGLLAWVYLKRRPRCAFWVGLAIAISGSAVIVSADLLHRASFGPADFLAVAASSCFAVYLLVTERIRERLDAITLLALSLVGTSVALIVFNAVAGVSLHVPDARAWLALLGLAVICQLLGYFLLTYALGHLSAAITSVTLLSQAPLTALLAVIFFGGSPNTLSDSGRCSGVVWRRNCEQVRPLKRKAVLAGFNFRDIDARHFFEILD